MGTLRAEFYYDDESRNWHFLVPALHVVGGGVASRTEAEQMCVDAIDFVLSDDPDPDPVDAVDMVDMVDMTVSVTLPNVA